MKRPASSQCWWNRIVLALLFQLFATVTAPAIAAKDEVVFTFATVGDSRYDAKIADATPEEKLWQQHVRPFSRILREIGAQKPQALFFNGDMIMGYTTNAHVLDRQYAYWRGMVAGLIDSGVYLVPVPGNHEVQIPEVRDGVTNKWAHPAGENSWRTNMGDLILNTKRWHELTGARVHEWNVDHRPEVGGPDGIRTDQSQLSYSFDCRGIHFCIINTDAVGLDSKAPNHWLAGDLSAARVRGNRHLFVFGHKMAYTYQFRSKGTHLPKGLDIVAPDRDAFWGIMEQYGATYFCGHEHIYHAMRPRPDGPNPSWQIIAGSGGSPFEAAPGDSTNPNDRKYVWVLVKVYASGRVMMEAYGFDDTFGPTQRIETIELAKPLPIQRVQKR